MTELEASTFKRIQAIAKEINLTFQFKEEEFETSAPMNIDSLEYMSLIIELQSQLGVQIPDEEVHAKNLKSIRNLVGYILNPRTTNG